MFKTPYRPCPVCRTQLERLSSMDTQDGWEYYECSRNCGTIALLKPFARPVFRKDDGALQEQVNK